MLGSSSLSHLNQTRLYSSSTKNNINNPTSNPVLSHVKPTGEAHMVDVGAKQHTRRTAIAIAHVPLNTTAYDQILSNSNKKGDVLATARIAGLMAAKRTPDLIPLCHPLALTSADVAVYLVPPGTRSAVWPGADGQLVAIQARVECVGPTGVEMEALTAVQGTALTVVDMCKAVDKGLRICEARVVYKAGGRSGVLVDEGWRDEVGRERFGKDWELREGVGEVLVRGRKAGD